MAVSEDDLLRHLNQLGAVTHEQIESAELLQKNFVASGHAEPLLSDVLIMQGIITPAVKDNAVKKLEAPEQGGIQQLGQYRLLKKLGEGGMGAVFLAEDTVAHRRLAIKLLPAGLAGNAEFLSRFRREAKAAGKLNHPNIIAAYGAGEELGHHFYLMEYCEGEPLEKRIKRERVLDWPVALDITRQAAEGLKYAHQQGLVHRDIKPANLFITQEGHVKILDLGLAKNTLDAESSFQTAAGMAIGTPHYISPEQARGEKNVDGRSDIYSLGATLYHMLTGSTLYEGSSAGIIMTLHVAGEIPDPQKELPHLPDSVAAIVRTMLSKEIDARYASCDDLLKDISRALSGKAPAAEVFEASRDGNITTRRKLRSVGSTTKAVTPVATRQPGRNDSRQSGPLSPASKIRPSRTGTASDFVWLYGVAGGLAVLTVLYFFFANGKKQQITRSQIAAAEPAKPDIPAAAPVAVEAQKFEPKMVPAHTPIAVPETPSPTKAPILPPQTIIQKVQDEYSKISAPEHWAGAVNLIDGVDIKQDLVRGKATKDNTSLVLEPGNVSARVDIPYQPPAEYDYRIVFKCPDTRPTAGGGDFIVAIPRNGRNFGIVLGGNGNQVCGLDAVNGAGYQYNQFQFRQPNILGSGSTQTVLIAVRNNHFTCWLNEKVLIDTDTDYATWEMKPGLLPTRDKNVLGIGSWTDTKVIYSVSVIDVTGKGVKTR